MTDTGAALLEEAALDKVRAIGGNVLLARLIDSFLEHAPPRVAAARAGQQAGEMDAVARATHSLKSTAGNLGARRLQFLAERVEALATAHDGAGVSEMLDQVESVFEATRIALARRREELAP